MLWFLVKQTSQGTLCQQLLSDDSCGPFSSPGSQSRQREQTVKRCAQDDEDMCFTVPCSFRSQTLGHKLKNAAWFVLEAFHFAQTPKYAMK